MSVPDYGYNDGAPLVNMFTDREVIFTAADNPYKTPADLIGRARTSRSKWDAANPASHERCPSLAW